MEGFVGAVNAASSFAKGYAQVALIERRQARINTQWERQFAFQEAQAQVAKDSMDRQWAHTMKVYQDEEGLRNLRLDAAAVTSKLAHIQLDEAEARKAGYGAALSEISDLIGTVDLSDPEKAFKQYTGGATAIAAKFPFVELKEVMSFLDTYNKTAMATMAGNKVHTVKADIGKSGHTVLRMVGTGGTVINSVELNKTAPEVTELVKEFDERIHQHHQDVLAETKTVSGVMNSLNHGVLTFQDGIESGDPGKQEEGRERIAASLEAKYLERVGKELEWFENSLAEMGIDEESRKRTVALRTEGIRKKLEMPLMSTDEYADVFVQAFEEDLKNRPGLDVPSWHDAIKREVYFNFWGKHKLNALDGLSIMTENYRGPQVAGEVSIETPIKAPKEYELLQTPEGISYQPKAKPIRKEKKDWGYIADQEPGAGGETGGIKINPVYHKRVQEFLEGKYK